MIHGFSEQEWNDYVESLVDETTRDRIEAHLIGCISCWEFNEQLARTTQAVRTGGDRLREVFVLGDEQLHSGLRGVFEKIRQFESAELQAEEPPHRAIQQKLDKLAAVMTPMCGSQTALMALQAAASESQARSLEKITADNWTPFLTSLKSIAIVMCGETGGHLVWESGQF